jgi:outer membrane protein assembly factor BamB
MICCCKILYRNCLQQHSTDYLGERKKMNAQNRRLYTIALILVMTVPMLLITALPIARAPVLDIPTYPMVNCAPNPVGVGQICYINVFMTKPTPTAGMAGVGDQYENIMVNIVKPDGKNITVGPLRSDSTGGTWANFKPTVNGTYIVQMIYPGGTLKTGSWAGSKLLPSISEPFTLTVQNEPIANQYNTPNIPTEYWSRPIYGTNWAWSSIGGNWFGLAAPSFATTGMYDATGNVQLYTTAPNTGHIVWKKATQFGGMPGDPITADQSSQYNSISIAINYFEPIVMNGMLYYTKYASANSKNLGWMAVDLRTGETVWERTAGESGSEVLKMGQILRFHTQQEFGSVAYLWSSRSSFYSVYDAMTGIFLSNVTNVSSASYLLDYANTDQEGTLLGWYASGGKLCMWNSTLMLLGGNKATQVSNATAVKVSSSTYNWTKGIQYQVEIPNYIGSAKLDSNMSVAAVTPEIVLTRVYASPGMFQEMGYGYQITAGFNAKTGDKLWGPINQTTPYLQDVALLTARSGTYILHDKDTDEAYGYSLQTGQLKWGPVKLPGNAWSTISRDAEIAYGKVLIWDFGGYVNALDPDTGDILWTFTPRSSGYDAPYGIYPLWEFNTQTICDGKLFLSEGSMYNPPIHPAKRLAINITDGSLVWSIMSYSGRIPAAHADTYMVEWDSLDCQITTFGKGPTTTSITAAPKVATKDTDILIEGTVIDTSAGTKTTDKQARFPNGVSAVSDESMSPFMEYVYMQQTKPNNTTGVKVHLTALDPNNNGQDLGYVQADADGRFALLWKPTMAGIYTLKASFEGSESYYISYGTTSLGVVEPSAAPATSTPPPATTAPPTTAPPTTAPPTTSAPQPKGGIDSVVYVGIAAVVLIVVVAAIAVLLRRRK